MNAISINLPQNTKYLDQILKLNTSQFQKVIEMGYTAYLGTIENIYQINNKEYNNKVKEIKEQHHTEMLIKQKEITELNNIISQIKISNKQNQEIMLENLKIKLNIQFKSDIDYKNSKINELKSEIND